MLHSCCRALCFGGEVGSGRVKGCSLRHVMGRWDRWEGVTNATRNWLTSPSSLTCQRRPHSWLNTDSNTVQRCCFYKVISPAPMPLHPAELSIFSNPTKPHVLSCGTRCWGGQKPWETAQERLLTVQDSGEQRLNILVACRVLSFFFKLLKSCLLLVNWFIFKPWIPIALMKFHTVIYLSKNKVGEKTQQRRTCGVFVL